MSGITESREKPGCKICRHPQCLVSIWQNRRDSRELPAQSLLSYEWWKQLYGESEGKMSKGIFPAGVNFTTDLHSMGQYIQDGTRMMFEDHPVR